jgi:NTE family protein
MKSGLLKIFCFLLVVLLMPAINGVFGQKVAVVLSGGGSRGTAHIGVLRALEENNIPIDYITGTSIGALVGGMYASGYSTDEIEVFFTSEMFARWANGNLDPKYSYYYKKDADDASWISFNIDLKKSFSAILPTNFISPVEMDFQLMELFAGASATAGYNFDSLFIPFRCVASDIDSNKSVVLRSGDLGKSIRASLTFPFYFKPVEIDDKLLFDGGMYNNFPSDVAIRDFHPDIIIGSKVSGNYPKSDPDDILTQIQNMLMSDTDFSLKIDSGIMIEPPVVKVSLVDFSTAKSFIQIGYDETNRRMDEIKKIVSHRHDDFYVDSLRRNFNHRKPDYRVDSIYISGLNKGEAAYVYQTLTHKSPNTTLGLIEPEYFKLAADNKIKQIVPSLKYDEAAGNYDLFLKIKPADKFVTKFGGKISSRGANQALVELQYKRLFRNALQVRSNVYFGKFYTSVLLGTRLDIPMKTPLSFGAQLVYNHFDYFKSSIHFFEDVTPSFLVQDDNYFRVFASLPTTNKGKFVADFTIGILENQYYQDNSFTREDTTDKTRFSCMAASLSWDINTLNRKQYATAGARFLINVSYINGDEKFTSGSLSGSNGDEIRNSHQWFAAKVAWDNYFEKIGPFTFGFYGEVRLSTQDLFSNYTSSLLAAPAFEPVPESKSIFLSNFRAYNYGAFGLKAIYYLGKRFDLRAESYLFQPYEQIMVDDENMPYLGKQFDARYFSFSGGLVYHSFIGPMSITFNYFDNPEEQAFFAFNIGYIIFNDRALK